MVVRIVFWILILIEAYSYAILAYIVRSISSPYLNWINIYTNNHVFVAIICGYLCSVSAFGLYIILKKMKRLDKAQVLFYSIVSLGTLIRGIGAVRAILILQLSRRIHLPQNQWLSMFFPFVLVAFLEIMQLLWYLVGVILKNYWWKKYFIGSSHVCLEINPWSSVVLLSGVGEDDPIFTRNSFCRQYSLGLQYLLYRIIIWINERFEMSKKEHSSIYAVAGAIIYVFLRIVSIGENGIIFLSSNDVQRLSHFFPEANDSIDRHIRIRVQGLTVQQAEQVASIWEDAAQQSKIRLDSVVYYLIPNTARPSTDVPGIRDFSLDGRLDRLTPSLHSNLPAILFSEMNRFSSLDLDASEKGDGMYSHHYANPIEILTIIGDQQLIDTYYSLSRGNKYLFEFLHNAMLCDNHLTSFRMCLNFCELLLCSVWLYVGLRQNLQIEQILDDNIMTIKEALIHYISTSKYEHNLNGRLRKEYPIFKNPAIACYLYSIDVVDINTDISYSFSQIAELLHYIRVRVDHSNAYTSSNRHAAWSTVSTFAFILCEILDFEHFGILLEESKAYIGYENGLIPTVLNGINLVRNNSGHPEFARMHYGRIQYVDYYTGNYIIPEMRN